MRAEIIYPLICIKHFDRPYRSLQNFCCERGKVTNQTLTGWRCYTISINSDGNYMKKKKKKQICSLICATSLFDNESDKFLRENTATGTASTGNTDEIVMTGTTARGRRLLKIREEKRKREHDRFHSYPPWAKVLEDACKDDSELRAVLGDSIGNPELMRKRVEERVRTKGRDFSKSKTGSILSFKVSFRE